MNTADPKKLPHLLKLLDDESEEVQKVIYKELIAFGPSLEEELAKLPEKPTDQQKKLIQQLFASQNRIWLKESWGSWFDIENDKEKLEAAFHLLAEFQSSGIYKEKLKTLLDGLAQEYRETSADPDPYGLARFLFSEKNIKGVKDDYYNPQNSNLIYCIKEKKGIPISLSCIYILVGKRMGLKIEGCNLPGHFMAKTTFKGKDVLVDCFNEGHLLEEKQVININPEYSEQIQEIIHAPVDAETTIARVLNNLIQAYQSAADWDNSYLVIDLLEILEREKGF